MVPLALKSCKKSSTSWRPSKKTKQLKLECENRLEFHWRFPDRIWRYVIQPHLVGDFMVGLADCSRFMGALFPCIAHAKNYRKRLFYQPSSQRCRMLTSKYFWWRRKTWNERFFDTTCISTPCSWTHLGNMSDPNGFALQTRALPGKVSNWEGFEDSNLGDVIFSIEDREILGKLMIPGQYWID